MQMKLIEGLAGMVNVVIHVLFSPPWIGKQSLTPGTSNLYRDLQRLDVPVNTNFKDLYSNTAGFSTLVLEIHPKCNLRFRNAKLFPASFEITCRKTVRPYEKIIYRI